MKDALPLLATLQGHGVTAKEANRSGWTGGFGNITYDSGPAPGALVNMDHLMHESIEPVWDVIGVINGTNPDEVVVVGNHRGQLSIFSCCISPFFVLSDVPGRINLRFVVGD